MGGMGFSRGGSRHAYFQQRLQQAQRNINIREISNDMGMRDLEVRLGAQKCADCFSRVSLINAIKAAA